MDLDVFQVVQASLACRTLDKHLKAAGEGLGPCDITMLWPMLVLAANMSVCVCCPCCCLALPTQEMQDFNLDDQARVRWDPMLKRAWLLQSGPDVGHTCDQLVVYLRRWVGTTVWGGGVPATQQAVPLTKHTRHRHAADFTAMHTSHVPDIEQKVLPQC